MLRSLTLLLYMLAMSIVPTLADPRDGLNDLERRRCESVGGTWYGLGTGCRYSAPSKPEPNIKDNLLIEVRSRVSLITDSYVTLLPDIISTVGVQDCAIDLSDQSLKVLMISTLDVEINQEKRKISESMTGKVVTYCSVFFGSKKDYRKAISFLNIFIAAIKFRLNHTPNNPDLEEMLCFSSKAISYFELNILLGRNSRNNDLMKVVLDEVLRNCPENHPFSQDALAIKRRLGLS